MARCYPPTGSAVPKSLCHAQSRFARSWLAGSFYTLLPFFAERAETEMAARLGKIIYWLACGIAVLALLLSAGVYLGHSGVGMRELADVLAGRVIDGRVIDGGVRGELGAYAGVDVGAVRHLV